MVHKYLFNLNNSNLTQQKLYALGGKYITNS